MYIIEHNGKVIPRAFDTMDAATVHLTGLQAHCVSVLDDWSLSDSGTIVARWEGPDGAEYAVRRLWYTSDFMREWYVENVVETLNAPGVTVEHLQLVRRFADRLTGQDRG